MLIGYIIIRQLADGFLESVYEKCLLIELQKADLQVKAQVPINVYYDTEIVG